MTHGIPKAGISRRAWLASVAAVAATAAGLGSAVRLSGYESPAAGLRRLSAAQAATLGAACEAFWGSELPVQRGVLVDAVDRYLLTMSTPMLRDVDALFFAFEQLTPLGGQLRRFTRMSHDEVREFVDVMEASEGLRQQIYRGMRDLCMLALWQQPSVWESIGYDGPMVDDAPRRRHAAYAALEAAPGLLPRAAGARA